MNIRCIFRHKWEYSICERVVNYNMPTINKLPKNLSVKISDKVRICKRCYKKQRKLGFKNDSENNHWVNDYLTKDELRDKKLKELGI